MALSFEGRSKKHRGSLGAPSAIPDKAPQAFCYLHEHIEAATPDRLLADVLCLLALADVLSLRALCDRVRCARS